LTLTKPEKKKNKTSHELDKDWGRKNDDWEGVKR